MKKIIQRFTLFILVSFPFAFIFGELGSIHIGPSSSQVSEILFLILSPVLMLIFLAVGKKMSWIIYLAGPLLLFSPYLSLTVVLFFFASRGETDKLLKFGKSFSKFGLPAILVVMLIFCMAIPMAHDAVKSKTEIGGKILLQSGDKNTCKLSVETPITPYFCFRKSIGLIQHPEVDLKVLSRNEVLYENDGKTFKVRL